MGANHLWLLFAGCLVTCVLGSIHGFSVFILQLEATLGLQRSAVSLIYSFALVCLTGSVLLGWRIYGLWRPSMIVMAACAVAAAGLWLAASAESWWPLFFGYSVLFGTANGVGYGFVLQLMGKLTSAGAGFAMALVTAAYGVGATVFALLLAHWLGNESLETALTNMALVILLAGLTAAIVLQRNNASYPKQVGSAATDQVPSVQVLGYWTAYGLSVFAGLMAIGHASEILAIRGDGMGAEGVVMIGVGNVIGGLLAAFASRRLDQRTLLGGLPLLAAACLVTLAITDNLTASIIMLILVGLCYGALIAIYPAAVNNSFAAQGPRVYGQVFTAWGVAGLCGPWLAGLLFDLTGGYLIALLVAAVLSLGSAILVYLLSFVGRPLSGANP